MSEQIQEKLNALARTINDEWGSQAELLEEANARATEAAKETNKLREESTRTHEALVAQQATLAAANAENVRLRRELEALRARQQAGER